MLCLCGKSVLYVSPTHALVRQVEKDLTERVGQIETAKSIEDISLDDDIDVLPPISVVTPERCFALLSFALKIFSNVGLLIFDEFQGSSLCKRCQYTIILFKNSHLVRDLTLKSS